jgi:hypothetical protein
MLFAGWFLADILLFAGWLLVDILLFAGWLLSEIHLLCVTLEDYCYMWPKI